MADEGAARLTKNPQWLQSALLKTRRVLSKDAFSRSKHQQQPHMMIVNPFSKSNFFYE